MEGKKTKPRIVFSCRIKPETAEKAVKAAKRHKLTRSKLIEQSLNYYLLNVLS